MDDDEFEEDEEDQEEDNGYGVPDRKDRSQPERDAMRFPGQER